MPMFLDTEGYADIAIAICDRCRMKRPHATLGPDINFPGLMVCEENCRDEKDPYRLPARQTERINLRFPRPDVSVAAIQNNLVLNDQQSIILSTEGNTQTPENNGNLDGLAISP
ncbi:MAG: hypothetical protein ACO3RS_10080 [Candidatus Puniceispirillaceae bacterium]|jgi:hypothetical protein